MPYRTTWSRPPSSSDALPGGCRPYVPAFLQGESECLRGVPHAGAERELRVDHRVLEGDLNRKPVQQRRQGDGEFGRIDPFEFTGILAIAHDAGDGLAPLGVEFLPPAAHLWMPYGLRPEVEPQGP